MPATPGRPHSPTLHPRTRNEASEYALRARATGDWFRHDGKNVEVAPSPPTRLTNERAHEFADRNKGEPDQWYQHDPTNPTDPPPAPRQPTADSRQYSTKIYGRDEPWYKHDDNRDYFSPRPRDKLGYGADDNKEKIGKADTMDWYRHDHGADDQRQATPARHRTPQYAAETTGEIADRVRPAGSPGWANYENGAGDATPQRKQRNPGAGEFLDRNRHGNVDEWFGHHPESDTPRYSDTPRVGTLEGQEIAVKNRGESENWYDHDANRDYRDPQPGGKGSNTADMVERSRGGDMERILRQEERGGSARGPDARVKPEARDTAEKNLKGVMDKFLNQDLNADYHSARKGPRVRPEASETFEKNKGVMADCLQGHPAPPPNRAANRVKPEAQEFAVRNKGTAAKVISDPGALPSSARMGGRVKPEAAEYAERNKGTMASLLMDYSGPSNEPVRAPRLKTDLARELAERNRGTVGSLFGMSGY